MYHHVIQTLADIEDLVPMNILTVVHGLVIGKPDWLEVILFCFLTTKKGMKEG